jgi:hypothetical protein
MPGMRLRVESSYLVGCLQVAQRGIRALLTLARGFFLSLNGALLSTPHLEIGRGLQRCDVGGRARPGLDATSSVPIVPGEAPPEDR